ncbi:zinc finger protein 331 isoform X5 [Lagenorhynchus albirostris]|uniref:zinc finger protein 331 isoform X5 n=1 Tax=Lagenorhynchus albirostris TaxID=27610 RepID=UPI0028F15535|nr:zinc finger protein 331 isoform X5 [Lagenorhynchus albirostris]
MREKEKRPETEPRPLASGALRRKAAVLQKKHPKEKESSSSQILKSRGVTRVVNVYSPLTNRLNLASLDFVSSVKETPKRTDQFLNSKTMAHVGMIKNSPGASLVA